MADERGRVVSGRCPRGHLLVRVNDGLWRHRWTEDFNDHWDEDDEEFVDLEPIATADPTPAAQPEQTEPTAGGDRERA